MAPLIAPSILSADFAHLADEAAAVAGADWLHVDVMDNHFVPNLTLGLPVVKSLLKATDIPIDCHLMITDPDRWADRLRRGRRLQRHGARRGGRRPDRDGRQPARRRREGGAVAQTGHRLDDWVDVLKHYDTLLVMTVEPGFGGQSFMADMMGKVRRARTLVDTGHLTVIVQVDGGISADTIEQAAEAGADCFVAGSAVYSAKDPAAAVAGCGPRRPGTARAPGSRRRASRAAA